jgi:hypothetical protein
VLPQSLSENESDPPGSDDGDFRCQTEYEPILTCAQQVRCACTPVQLNIGSVKKNVEPAVSRHAAGT